MKKFCIILISVLLSLVAFAQIDDIYYSPKKDGKKEVKVEKTVVEDEWNVHVTKVSPAKSTQTRDVDEYNRRTDSEEDVSDDIAANAKADDYEYTQRLAKFHGANVYVNNASVVVDSETGDVYVNGNNTSANRLYVYDSWYSPYSYSSSFYWGNPYYSGWSFGWSSWGSPYYSSWGYTPYYYSSWYSPYYYYPRYYSHSHYYPSYSHNHHYYDRHPLRPVVSRPSNVSRPSSVSRPSNVSRPSRVSGASYNDNGSSSTRPSSVSRPSRNDNNSSTSTRYEAPSRNDNRNSNSYSAPSRPSRNDSYSTPSRPSSSSPSYSSPSRSGGSSSGGSSSTPSRPSRR